MPSGKHRGGAAVSRVSFSLIAAVFLVLSTSLAVGVANELHKISAASIAPSNVKPRYLVLFVLDGAQPWYLHVESLPHLDALMSGGVEYDRAFAGILESETPAGHATLATGSTPARDGLLGFNWITDRDDTIHLFNPDLIRQGAIEHIMEQAGAPTIAGLFKQRYPKAKVAALSGHKYYAADPLGGPNADYILYYAPDSKGRYVPTAIPGHVPPADAMNAPNLIWPSLKLPTAIEDTLATKISISTFERTHPRIMLINLPEFDWPLGHVYGADLPHVKALMEGFDRDLGMIEDAYAKAGVLAQTDFVITADHGMSALEFQIPDGVLDNAVTKAGTSSPETTYSTNGYIWLQDPAKAQAVAAGVVAAKDPHIQSVYYKVAGSGGDSWMRAGGLTVPSDVDAANRYLLESFSGGNAPDVVAFCAENAAFVTKGAESWKANHGGGAWLSQSMPLVLSGPGINAGIVSHDPARIEDIAPTVLSLLGVQPSGMQGTVLADALRSPTSQQTAAQQAVDRQLAPVVQSLMAESNREIQAESSQ